ncbi:CyP450 monooxygenase [Suillus subaureus]|uniref:CyP450 monooxygenase n=1 Tax=Suillus subaureus TaxID=48587 RepID=A0A9P7J868_9AGAM|nr:CyP450 monooxygenase [Suillus subaureus]KAG1807773.1 CyP450 monooxygenase [Suillus subaureus]
MPFQLYWESTNKLLFPNATVGSLIQHHIQHTAKSAGLPLPPGPRSLPFIGNIGDIDVVHPWRTYSEWKDKYGPIVSCRLIGQTVVIINSEKIARQLLDQRSAIYSDRPAGPFLPYGDTLRLHRRLFHQALRADAADSYRDLYLDKARQLLSNLLNSPEAFEKHLFLYTASIIMSVTYGHDKVSWDAPPIKSVAELVELINVGLVPERSAILTAFPILTRLPAWFPGASFQRIAQRTRKLALESMNEPFEYVKRNMAAGNAPKSLVSDLLTEMDEGKEAFPEQAVKQIALTVFVGYSSTLSSFILAMVLHPEAQRLAQQEIDSVVGVDRLPDFYDRPSLKYVEAVFREAIRWHVVAPLGIPHATSSDDVFGGYFIPKGSLILPNIWYVEGHDDPDIFKPERHFASDGTLLPDTIAAKPMWGFGRRGCPGRFIAEAATWSAVVHLLAAFRITKAKDETGKEIEVKEEFTSGVVCRPVPFQCSFVLRSTAREKAIRLGD